jgi:hypothetical protein
MDILEVMPEIRYLIVEYSPEELCGELPIMGEEVISEEDFYLGRNIEDVRSLKLRFLPENSSSRHQELPSSSSHERDLLSRLQRGEF